MGFGWYDDQQTPEERAQERREFEVLLQGHRDKEIPKWQEFLKVVKSPKIKQLFEQALAIFEQGKHDACDDLLRDNYRMIMKFPEAEEFLGTLMRGVGLHFMHPLHEYFIEQLAISRADKPAIGTLVPRYMHVIRDPDGLYEVTPARPSRAENGTPIMRVIKNPEGEGWIACSIRNAGIIVYIDEVPKQAWSHLEIMQVGPRTCRAVPRYVDFEEQVKKAAVAFYKFIGGYGKVRIQINWE